ADEDHEDPHHHLPVEAEVAPKQDGAEEEPRIDEDRERSDAKTQHADSVYSAAPGGASFAGDGRSPQGAALEEPTREESRAAFSISVAATVRRARLDPAARLSRRDPRAVGGRHLAAQEHGEE